MLTRRSVISMLTIAAMILVAGVASGQNFPTKPIRILVGSAGGGNDLAARMIAQGISGPLGQPVIVENRGSTVITSAAVASSPPDGYTLTLAGDLIWLGPLLRNSQIDPLRDFAPVTMLGNAPMLLVVHPSLPVKSVKELIALAKARPGELNYSSSAAGSIDHIAGELFKSMTGANIGWVPYKGDARAQIALMGGEVQMMFVSVASVSANIKSGRLRALAVTSGQPSMLAAGMPTMAASGVPGFELVGMDAIYAPAKTPAAVINRLNQEIVRFAKTPEGRERYLNLGAELIASSPEEHAARLKSRITVIGKLIKDAGIKVE